MLELESERLIFGLVALLELGLDWSDFSSLFFKLVCQTFLISLSVLPGNLAAIADHLKIRIKMVNYYINEIIARDSRSHCLILAGQKTTSIDVVLIEDYRDSESHAHIGMYV